MIEAIYNRICRFLSKNPKWHSVVIHDVDGKSTAYLDGVAYLFYDHILGWWYKRKIKKHPFLMFKSLELSSWRRLWNIKDK